MICPPADTFVPCWHGCFRRLKFLWMGPLWHWDHRCPDKCLPVTHNLSPYPHPAPYPPYPTPPAPCPLRHGATNSARSGPSVQPALLFLQILTTATPEPAWHEHAAKTTTSIAPLNDITHTALFWHPSLPTHNALTARCCATLLPTHHTIALRHAICLIYVPHLPRSLHHILPPTIHATPHPIALHHPFIHAHWPLSCAVGNGLQHLPRAVLGTAARRAVALHGRTIADVDCRRKHMPARLRHANIPIPQLRTARRDAATLPYTFSCAPPLPRTTTSPPSLRRTARGAPVTRPSSRRSTMAFASSCLRDSHTPYITALRPEDYRGIAAFIWRTWRVSRQAVTLLHFPLFYKPDVDSHGWTRGSVFRYRGAHRRINDTHMWTTC